MSSDDFDPNSQEHLDGHAGDDYAADDAGDSAFVVTEAKKPLSKGTLAMFFIVLCAGGGIFLMYQRGGPSQASAADPKATQVIKQFMSDKEKNFSLMQKMIKDTEAVVQQFISYPSLKQVPLSDLQTNPFRLSPEKADDGSESLAQRLKREDEEKRRREEERQAVLRAAQGLNLQSVVHSGNHKACMVNNTLYLEGHVIEAGDASFTIEQISPNRVVVRSGSYRFELTMQK